MPQHDGVSHVHFDTQASLALNTARSATSLLCRILSRVYATAWVGAGMAGPQTSSLARSISTSRSISPAAYLRAKGAAGHCSAWSGVLGQTVLSPACHQAGDLCAAVATGAPQVGQYHATLGLLQPGVVKALEHTADVFVAFGVHHQWRRELDLGGCVEKFLQLRNRAQLCFVHVDHHLWMINPWRVGLQLSPSGSFLGGNTRAVQAHTSLDNDYADPGSTTRLIT